MMNDLMIQILVPFLTAFLGGFAGWFFKRKRLEIENRNLKKTTESQDITNIDAAVRTWKNVVDALEEQVTKLLKQRQEYSNQIEELTKEVVGLRQQVRNLQKRLEVQADDDAKIRKYETLLATHGIAY